ncbi:hypothetical protein [Bradyrhizobium archetypum]|uniref:hypothetical protein n=1 Tax=Bradyrhizobium archetypum TaxID=2721160 RepID=UPI001F3786C2|nr:hypothetical protein [Bradyrhizobium archetypum]
MRRSAVKMTAAMMPATEMVTMTSATMAAAVSTSMTAAMSTSVATAMAAATLRDGITGRRQRGGENNNGNSQPEF